MLDMAGHRPHFLPQTRSGRQSGPKRTLGCQYAGPSGESIVAPRRQNLARNSVSGGRNLVAVCRSDRRQCGPVLPTVALRYSPREIVPGAHMAAVENRNIQVGLKTAVSIVVGAVVATWVIVTWSAQGTRDELSSLRSDLKLVDEKQLSTRDFAHESNTDLSSRLASIDANLATATASLASLAASAEELRIGQGRLQVGQEGLSTRISDLLIRLQKVDAGPVDKDPGTPGEAIEQKRQE